MGGLMIPSVLAAAAAGRKRETPSTAVTTATRVATARAPPFGSSSRGNILIPTVPDFYNLSQYFLVISLPCQATASPTTAVETDPTGTAQEPPPCPSTGSSWR